MKSKTRDKLQDFERAMVILQEQADPSPCRMDHNNSCQQHFYFYLAPGEVCGNLEAQQLLAKYGCTTEGDNT